MVEDGGDRHCSNTLPLLYLTVLSHSVIRTTLIALTVLTVLVTTVFELCRSVSFSANCSSLR